VKSKPRRATKTQAAGRAKRALKSTNEGSARSTANKSTPRQVDRLLETGGTVLLDLKFVRFAGVALGGGKTDKTAIAILEFYPDQRRVFLRSLREKISSSANVSADEVLISILNDEEKDLALIALDVPLQLPKFIRCQLKCPGVERCREPEVKWMREVHKSRDKHKRPNKMFTPYTERAVEVYIANELEEPFHPSHAFGANAAPLTARAHFLSRRLSVPLSEVYPKLSLWRIGCALDIPKSHLRFHKHAVDSDEARLHILRTLIDREIAFIYQQDLRLMVENNVCFEAFICALTGFLKYREQTEKRPHLFPKDELWIDFPKQKINWFD
jgi:hypothetical protein